MLAHAAGGWAKQIVESESMLLPFPFRQVALNRALRLLLSAPEKLEEMSREACVLGSRLDLKHRFEVAADIITGKDVSR